MGRFFSCISLRCSKTRLKNALRECMAGLGYRTDNRAPELRFHILPDINGWVALHQDVGFDGPAEQLPAHLSGMLGLPVLHIACFDSDCLYLTLHRGGICSSACAGMPYDGDPPEPDPDFWRAIVPDFERFCEILRSDYVFAEEALPLLGELIGFDGSGMLAPDDDVLTLGFSRAGVKEKPLITSGPPRLGHMRAQQPLPYRLNGPSTITLHNFGGPGRGVEIIAQAAFAHRADLRLEICDVHLRTLTNQLSGMPAQPCRGSFECIEREAGRSVWRASFPDFEIPAGINLNYKHPSSSKQMQFDYQQCFVFSYQLCIPEHLSELTFRFIPMECPDGAYTWRLQDCAYTPQALEIFEKEGPDAFHRYIQK